MMNDASENAAPEEHHHKRELLILACGILPPLLLGVAWMRQTGIPAAVYMQNLVATIAGLALAAYGARRRASPALGVMLTVGAILLLLATLMSEGMQGVHRWIRVGPLAIHPASLAIPILLVELHRILLQARLAVAFGVMLTTAAVLAMQPDAGQATAFAGSCIVLLILEAKRKPLATAGMLALVLIAALSFSKSDPLAPVAHVEEIATRIAEQGTFWNACVVIALTLLVIPFVVRTPKVARIAGLAVAVYVALVTSASYWGNFPVPVLGYGMSPIIGYFAGWTWLRAITNDAAVVAGRLRSA